jgi:hypothetical protein
MMNIPIRPNNKNLFIHSQIFAIPTSHICTHCTISLLF